MSVTEQLSKITMPRLNANDDDAVLVRWLKPARQRVSVGESIAQVETTKASVDIVAEVDGYLIPAVASGSRVAVGDCIAWIAATNDVSVAVSEKQPNLSSALQGRLVSIAAARLMAEKGLGPGDIPGDGPVTMRDVEAAIARRQGGRASSLDLVATMHIEPNAAVLFGAAEQGVVVLDCLRSQKDFTPLCFVDDLPRSSDLDGLPVFESGALLLLRQRGVRFAHVCIGSPLPKLAAAERLKVAGFQIVPALHARAVVSPTARLGEGVCIGPGAIVGPGAVIGDYSQINNNATVPHHVRIGVAVRISDGANIAGGVTIGDRSLLGLGVTVNTDCHIGSDVTIASGLSIFDSVPDEAIVRRSMTRR